MITSSPSVTPAARSARCRPVVPRRDGAGGLAAEELGEGVLEGGHPRAERELTRAQHLEDERLLLRPEDRLGHRDHVRRARPGPGRGCSAYSSESTRACHDAAMTFS